MAEKAVLKVSFANNLIQLKKSVVEIVTQEICSRQGKASFKAKPTVDN